MKHTPIKIKLVKIQLVIAGLFCMLCSNASYAEYDVADLQKLFTDKKQRAQIDAARSGKVTQAVAQTVTKKRTKKIKVTGFMTRSDGKSVVWINNKNTMDGSKIGSIKVHHGSVGKNNKVTVTVDGKRKQLKPGETWYKK